MTWTPRNRSEDEEEDENIDLEKNDDDEPNKPTDKGDSTDTEAGLWKNHQFSSQSFPLRAQIDCWLMVVYYL